MHDAKFTTVRDDDMSANGAAMLRGRHRDVLMPPAEVATVAAAASTAADVVGACAAPESEVFVLVVDDAPHVPVLVLVKLRVAIAAVALPLVKTAAAAMSDAAALMLH
jgi:hypothetical protein